MAASTVVRASPAAPWSDARALFIADRTLLRTARFRARRFSLCFICLIAERVLANGWSLRLSICEATSDTIGRPPEVSRTRATTTGAVEGVRRGE
jgi:hypothetical protein